MADGIVVVQPDSTGKKIDTSEITVGANTVERQRIVIADPATAAGLGAVLNAQPSSTDYGMVVREAQKGQTTMANSRPVVIASDNILSVIRSWEGATRTPVSLTFDRITGITTEALGTMSKNLGGTVTSGTTYTVSSVKTLRIQLICATILSTGSSTAANGRIRVRSAATVSSSSPIFLSLDIGNFTGTTGAGFGQFEVMTIADGIEFVGGTQIGISHIENTSSSTVSVCLVGFEY